MFLVLFSKENIKKFVKHTDYDDKTYQQKVYPQINKSESWKSLFLVLFSKENIKKSVKHADYNRLWW